MDSTKIQTYLAKNVIQTVKLVMLTIKTVLHVIQTEKEPQIVTVKMVWLILKEFVHYVIISVKHVPKLLVNVLLVSTEEMNLKYVLVHQPSMKLLIKIVKIVLIHVKLVETTQLIVLYVKEIELLNLIVHVHLVLMKVVK